MLQTGLTDQERRSFLNDFYNQARAHGFLLKQQQRNAWLEQVRIMRQAVRQFKIGHMLFEFAIPRMGKRADVVLVVGETVLVLEFKVGAASFDPSAIEQAQDYALDLKNFHRESHSLSIVPILIATCVNPRGAQEPRWASDMVAAPVLANADELPLISPFATGVGGTSMALTRDNSNSILFQTGWART